MTEVTRSQPSRGGVVVVTGASAGLGRAIALAFARRGARLGLIARDRERLETACREVAAAGGHAIALPADVSDAAAMEEAAARAEVDLGAVDIWVNNAMVSVFARVADTTAGEFKRVTDVTYLGYVYGTLAALRRMLPRDRGTIVQVGSALAYRGIPLQAAYSAAKHAIQGFCDSLRAELLHDGSRVHVTMVQMPALNTPQFDWSRSRMPRRAQPVPPIFDPAIGAEAVVWAAGQRKREVWVGWPTILALAGDRLAPGLAERIQARTLFEAQQTDEAEDPERGDNLFTTCEGPFGARGRFGDRARRVSPQLWLSRHRRWFGAGVALLAAAMALRRLGAPPATGQASGARRSARTAAR